MAVAAPRPPKGPSQAMEPFGKLKSVAIKSFSTRSASADCLNTLDGDGSKTPPNVDAQSETSSVTSYERLTDLIRWVPGSHTELFDAEDKLLAFVRSPHELVHVSIGAAADLAKRGHSNGAEEEESGKEIQKPSIFIPMVPSLNILPRFTVQGAVKLLDGIAQGVGFTTRTGMEDDKNCYVNTLLVGDVAKAFADCHRQDQEDDFQSAEDGETGGERGQGGAREPLPEGEHEGDEGAGASPEQKATMIQRLWASIMPFSKSAPADPKPTAQDVAALQGRASEDGYAVGRGDGREPGALVPDEPRDVFDDARGEDAPIQDSPDASTFEDASDEGAEVRPEKGGGQPQGAQKTELPEKTESAESDDRTEGRPGKGGEAQAQRARKAEQAGSEEPTLTPEQLQQDLDEAAPPVSASEKPNLVMVHGYAACLGFYFRNYDTLSQFFNIYAIDQLGWGASSRPMFTPESPEETETWFVEALELWRQEVGLTKFTLLGHSFGGFISARYALKYPQHVEHLVLVGPAGFNHVSPKMLKFRQTWKGYLLGLLWETNLTPQLMMRFLGPWSEDFVKRASTQRWSNLPSGQEQMDAEQVAAFSEYIFQSLLAPMSGELCMKHLFSLGAFARRPLIDSAPTWEVPTTFIYGVDDIMDYRAGLKAAKLMRTPVEVLLIQEVGHMLFLEKPTLFNAAVLHGCRDILPPDLPAVKEASQAVAPYIIPMDHCHNIPDGNSDALFQQGTGTVRLASGWGIG